MTLNAFIRGHCCNFKPHEPTLRDGTPDPAKPVVARCLMLDTHTEIVRCPVLHPDSADARTFRSLFDKWPAEHCGPHYCTHVEALLAGHQYADRETRYEYYRPLPTGYALNQRLAALMKLDIQEPRKARRACATPGCANALEPRHKLCASCAKVAARESNRRRNAKRA